MTTRLRFFGAAAFEIITPAGPRVMIDPFLDENPASPVKSEDLDKVDLVLVTHGAWDHLGDAANVAAGDGCPIICGPEVKEALTLGGLPPAQVLQEVIDLRTLVPLDVETVAVSAKKTNRIVVANDGYRTCGFAAELVATLMEHAFDYLDAPIARATCDDVPIPCAENLEADVLVSAHKIAAAVREVLR